jgi:hypothetical protein
LKEAFEEARLSTHPFDGVTQLMAQMGQQARGAGRRTVAQSIGAFLVGALHPLTDGAFADVERFGDLTLGPALLLETLGLEPSGFFPVGRCRVHA